MEFILEQDYLALVSKDQYTKMKTKADENEAKNSTTSTTETVVGVVTTAMIVGALGYAGYHCVNVIRSEARDTAIRQESYNLKQELAELKRQMGDA